jgi:two-component system, OmpR family, phosphate regulon sensor histidine kinase PhoR
MDLLARYLHPMRRLGKRNYSLFFPLFTMLTSFVIGEIIAYVILRDPRSVGMFAIFVPVALIIYFAFRDGLKGGLISAFLTIFYYIYIIYSRNYQGQELTGGLQTTLVLGGLYLLLAAIIGWLKQAIDQLIEQEANERRRFQAIVQQLPVGVIVTDSNGVIDFSNKRADLILGTKVPIGFKVGREQFVNIVESRPSPATQSILAKALQTGRSITNEEFVVERESGKRVYIEASATPVRNKEGKLIAAAEILSDVTEHRELEKRKDDFVNMASHELKTPITSMKLYLDALIRNEKKYEPAHVHKMIRVIRTQTDRLQKLVSDMLDVSRLQTGKLSFQKEVFNLSVAAEDLMNELQGIDQSKKLRFIGKGTMHVEADKFRIQQVLTNLITNAMKYSPDDKEIIVRVKTESGKALVSVEDRGIGIEKDQQKKIFDRLYQVTDSKEKTFPGLGMGLYISKEIIKRHKGQIWVESEKGKGSTFYFTLPLSRMKEN